MFKKLLLTSSTPFYSHLSLHPRASPGLTRTWPPLHLRCQCTSSRPGSCTSGEAACTIPPLAPVYVGPYRAAHESIPLQFVICHNHLEPSFYGLWIIIKVKNNTGQYNENLTTSKKNILNENMLGTAIKLVNLFTEYKNLSANLIYDKCLPNDKWNRTDRMRRRNELQVFTMLEDFYPTVLP